MGKEKKEINEPDMECADFFRTIIEALNELRQRQDALEKCLLDLTERMAEGLGMVEVKQVGMLGLILNHVHREQLVGDVTKASNESEIPDTGSFND